MGIVKEGREIMSSFRFRKKTEYGLMMVTLLARAGRNRIVSVRAMQELGLPRSFLVKIARDLIKAKLISAKEGRGGGYQLIVDPEKVNLKRVVEAMEGEVATAGCLIHGAKKCPLEKACPHKGVMGKLTQQLGEILANYRLVDLQ